MIKIVLKILNQYSDLLTEAFAIMIMAKIIIITIIIIIKNQTPVIMSIDGSKHLRPTQKPNAYTVQVTTECNKKLYHVQYNKYTNNNAYQEYVVPRSMPTTVPTLSFLDLLSSSSSTAKLTTSSSAVRELKNSFFM